MDTEFQVLAKCLVELGEVVLVVGNLSEEVHALLDDILADSLENLVLLKRLTGDVEGKTLGVDNTLDEVEVFGDAFEEVEWYATNRLVGMRQPK